MNLFVRWCARLLAVILLLCFANVLRAQVQDQRHVVSVDEFTKDAARPAETRQANEAALRQLFSSEQARQALKSANVDYGKVDNAVGRLSDDDLARLAERSRQLQNNFAAGRAGSLSDRDLLVILLVAILLIALIAVLR
jgi:hypothetical protein